MSNAMSNVGQQIWIGVYVNRNFGTPSRYVKDIKVLLASVITVPDDSE